MKPTGRDLDSDVLIDMLRGDARAASAIEMASHKLMSVVSLIEVTQGAKSKLEAGRIQKESTLEYPRRHLIALKPCTTSKASSPARSGRSHSRETLWPDKPERLTQDSSSLGRNGRLASKHIA